MSQTGDDGTIYDDAPLCLCCEKALAAKVYGRFLHDGDLGVPVCHQCALLLCDAHAILRQVPGISGCAPLGPDSGKAVQS